jgi:acetyl-CoA carboxylase/biotin carboxylase 1
MSYLVAKTEEEPTRKGVIVPVQYLDEAEEYLARALDIFPRVGTKKRPSNGLMPGLGGKRKIPPPKLENEEELAAVCNVAIRDAESLDDNETLARINRQ